MQELTAAVVCSEPTYPAGPEDFMTTCARVAVVSAIPLLIALMTASNNHDHPRASWWLAGATGSIADAGARTADVTRVDLKTVSIDTDRGPVQVLETPAATPRSSRDDRARAGIATKVHDRERAATANANDRRREKTLAGLLLMLRQGHGFR